MLSRCFLRVSRELTAVEPSDVSTDAEMFANIEKMKSEVLKVKEELFSLNQKIDAGKEWFMKFVFGFVSDDGENFLSLTREIHIKYR